MVSVEKILYIEVDCPNYNGLVQLATSGQVFGLLFRTVLAFSSNFTQNLSLIHTIHTFNFSTDSNLTKIKKERFSLFSRNLPSINLLLYFMVFIVDITVCDAVKV